MKRILEYPYLQEHDVLGQSGRPKWRFSLAHTSCRCRIPVNKEKTVEYLLLNISFGNKIGGYNTGGPDTVGHLRYLENSNK